MSQFLTKVPTQVADVIGLLPEGSDLVEIKLSEDGKTIEITWSNDWHVTPFTFPHEWPVELLCHGTMPEKIVMKPRNPPAVPPHTPIAPKKRLTNPRT